MRGQLLDHIVDPGEVLLGPFEFQLGFVSALNNRDQLTLFSDEPIHYLLTTDGAREFRDFEPYPAQRVGVLPASEARSFRVTARGIRPTAR